jgi:hypothetical protein
MPTTTGGDAGPTRTWNDETEHFNDTSVIDDWPAGYAGLFVGPQSSAAATEFDDVTMWIDTDSDGTLPCSPAALGRQQFADDFSSNEVTLTYDDNGNLTYDGVFTYVYDGWNRLRKVQRVAAGPTTTDVALYEYFADNRRSEKIVQHSGAEVVENDGGNTTVRFYYGGGVARPPSAGPGGAGFQPAGSRWNILETRNGSDQATFQYVWGTQYVDELVLIDSDPAAVCHHDALLGVDQPDDRQHRDAAQLRDVPLTQCRERTPRDRDPLPTHRTLADPVARAEFLDRPLVLAGADAVDQLAVNAALPPRRRLEPPIRLQPDLAARRIPHPWPSQPDLPPREHRVSRLIAPATQRPLRFVLAPRAGEPLDLRGHHRLHDQHARLVGQLLDVRRHPLDRRPPGSPATPPSRSRPSNPAARQPQPRQRTTDWPDHFFDDRLSSSPVLLVWEFHPWARTSVIRPRGEPLRLGFEPPRDPTKVTPTPSRGLDVLDVPVIETSGRLAVE